VGDEEYVLFDLTVPYMKPVLSFVPSADPASPGELAKFWLDFRYDWTDAGVQVETQLVQEFEPLNRSRAYERFYRYHNGELKAVWLSDVPRSRLLSQSAPWLAPWQVPVLALAVLVFGIPLTVGLLLNLSRLNPLPLLTILLPRIYRMAREWFVHGPNPPALPASNRVLCAAGSPQATASADGS
jgi:hypothetical protein